jgi:predicted urease superfamily metal-dependent hydrolase
MADEKSGLGASAAALEGELRKFEQLADLATRLELKSQKNLERAARAAEEAADAQGRVAERVRALVEEIARARGRQESQARQLEERALEIGARREKLDALLARFAQLGNDAAEVNALLKQGERVEEAEERLGRVADAAAELLRDAEQEGFEDAARQAESVRQQSLSARNKLKLLRERRQ